MTNKILSLKKKRKYYTKRPENKKAYFYPDEWKLFEELLTEKQRKSLMFMIQTGARIQELQNVIVNDVEWDRGNVNLRITKCKAIKGEKEPVPRKIPVSTQFLKQLNIWKNKYSLKKTDTFKLLSNNQINNVIKDNAKKIKSLKNKWKDLSSHNIRKTFITWCFALNIEPNKIALHIGNDLKTTMKHYASPDTFNKKDKVLAREILGDLFIK